MDVPGLIGRKRDGGELSGEQLAELVTGFLAGSVAPEQMSALLMAGVIRGFSDAEAKALTNVLLWSGDVLDLGSLRGRVVDKHSTGGVGDTTTLVVGPLLAAAGVQVPKLSGGGLGHTGGTIDKLASIPGFRTRLSTAELLRQVEAVGIAVCEASPELAPADKRLYALRDVTGTVPSPALIAASIMSKKLAAGSPNIVLDVKAGLGGVVGDVEAARSLARLCAHLGRVHGRSVRALVTDMSQPLGPAVGNALEIRAAIDVLAGAGGQRLRAACLAIATTAMDLTLGPGRAGRAEEVLASGAALEKFREWITAQGGPESLVDDPSSTLPVAPVRDVVLAPRSGAVVGVSPQPLGEAARRLGAGRSHPDDVVDPAVGVELHVRIGDEIVQQQPVATIHAASRVDAEDARRTVADAITIDPDTRPDPTPLVLAEIGASTEPD